MTDDVNTNTFQGQDGTDETSFYPTGQRKSIHISLSSKQENMNKYGQYTKKKLKKTPYHKASSVVFPPSLF